MGKLINDESINKALLKDTGYELEQFRIKREKLLQGLDVYKTNVLYGIIEESEVEQLEVKRWYKRLLDCDFAAVDDVPNEYIKKYAKIK